MNKAAGSKDPLHVRQAHAMDCSIACIAMLLRMTGTTHATLYDAHEVARDWTATGGLDPKILGPVLAKTFRAHDHDRHSEPKLEADALVLFMSSWVDVGGGIKNLGHYVVVRDSKLVAIKVNVEQDAETTSPPNVRVFKVYCPDTDEPYWTTWAALVGQGIHNVWRVPIN